MIIAGLVIGIIALDLLYLIWDGFWSSGNERVNLIKNEELMKTANPAEQNQVIKTGDSDMRTSVGIVILSVIIPIIGIILGCIYMQSYNATRYHAGKTYLKAALISLGICFVISFIFYYNYYSRIII